MDSDGITEFLLDAARANEQSTSRFAGDQFRKALARLEQRIEELESKIAELEEQLAPKEAQLAEIDQRINGKEEAIEQLRSQLREC